MECVSVITRSIGNNNGCIIAQGSHRLGQHTHSTADVSCEFLTLVLDEKLRGTKYNW